MADALPLLLPVRVLGTGEALPSRVVPTAEVAALWSDWDGFLATGEKYTAATGKPFVDNVETSVFYSTINQVTEKYYSPDGELVYDTNPQVEDAFDTAVQAHDAGISAGIAAFSSGWGPGRANGAFAIAADAQASVASASARTRASRAPSGGGRTRGAAGCG